MLCEPAIETDVIELPEGESSRLIEDACRAGAEAELIVSEEGDGIAGVVWDVTDDTLVFAPTSAQRVETASGSCEVRIASGTTTFWFRSDVRSAEAAETGGEGIRHPRGVTLHRPRRVLTRQRRRFWRAPVRNSSTVALGTDDSSWQHGDLLNVSACGLACRVAEDAGRSCAVGEKLRVRFRLDGDGGEPLECAAEVRSAAPGSDPSRTIVRVRFVPSSMSEDDRRRITQATGHCGDAP